jgi:hypothetical protein
MQNRSVFVPEHLMWPGEADCAERLPGQFKKDHKLVNGDDKGEDAFLR